MSPNHAILFVKRVHQVPNWAGKNTFGQVDVCLLPLTQIVSASYPLMSAGLLKSTPVANWCTGEDLRSVNVNKFDGVTNPDRKTNNKNQNQN